MIIKSFNLNNNIIHKSMTRYLSDLSWSGRSPKSYPDFLLNEYDKLAKEIYPDSENAKYSISQHNSVQAFLDMNNLANLLPTFASYSCMSTTTDNLLEKVKAFSPRPLELGDLMSQYPIAVKYTDGMKTWLIERPPFKATIDYKLSRASSESAQKSTSIWMPWTVMMIIADPENSYYDAYLYLNDSPLTSLEDIAIPCFHMNMYEDGRMCLNQTTIMLQQHLSQTQDFTIANIYNFLLNDYFTGGWNTDLGLNVFNRLCYNSSSMSQIKNKITRGDNQLNLKPATTPTGRLSEKKYFSNYFQYFSSIDLNQSIEIISNIKKDLITKDTKYYSTFQNVIDKQTKNKTMLPLLTDFTYEQEGYVENSFRFLLHPAHIPHITENKVNSTVSAIEDALHQYTSVDKVIEGVHKGTAYSDNPVLFIDQDFIVHELNEDFDFTTFKLKETLNV